MEGPPPARHSLADALAAWHGQHTYVNKKVPSSACLGWNSVLAHPAAMAGVLGSILSVTHLHAHQEVSLVLAILLEASSWFPFYPD